MKNPFDDYPQTKTVSQFSDLVSMEFKDDNNALCWYRNLLGNYEEIAKKLTLKENITEVSEDDLKTLSLSEQGDLAREIILNDIQLLTQYGANPSLNLLQYYERDTEFDFITTDVYSYHVDQSPVGTDTFLCTYYGAATEIIPNNQTIQKILIPEIREKLYNLYQGDEVGFDDFLKEYFFNLHYQALPNAQPINLGKGHLWRLAVEHPNQRVKPCVHRAPIENKDELRLLLIC